jgi:ubiquinone/menaquinone biosynthesis C-methylase UbiE
VEYLAARLGIGPGRTVVDLGAGTGKLTRALVPTRASLIAVEPLDEMRDTLERLVPAAEALAGTAEAIPLPSASVDAVVAGQAFHWFDAEVALREIQRVLRPGGGIGLIWNSRDLDDELQAALDAILRPHRRAAPSQVDRAWRAAVAASSAFGEIEERSFPWQEVHTRAEVVDRISSISFVAQLQADEQSRLLEHVREVVAGTTEPIAFRYRADVFVFAAE